MTDENEYIGTIIKESNGGLIEQNVNDQEINDQSNPENNSLHNTNKESKIEETEIENPQIDSSAKETEEEEEEEDFDDDFDDFEEAKPSTTNNQDNHNQKEEDDFEEFDEFNEFESQPTTTNNIAIPDSSFHNKIEFEKSLAKLMSKLFISSSSTTIINEKLTTDSLLNERSQTIYNQISKLPYLQPSNWIKSDIRHNLLIKLGIPINLDELKPVTPNASTTSTTKPPSSSSSYLQPPTNQHQRKKSISEHDLIWTVPIPNLEDLQISIDEKTKLIKDTKKLISKYEINLLENSTYEYLISIKNEIKLNEKLEQFKNIKIELIKLNSIWLNQLSELRKDYEIYETYIQSCIGYSQKLRREEILENLKKLNKNKKINNKRK